MTALDEIDLGHGHRLTFHCWAPDDLPANRELYGIVASEPMPVVEKWGAIVSHPAPDGGPCEGVIQFDGPWQRRAHAAYVAKSAEQGVTPRNYVAWTVEMWEPLTVSPSILCRRCGDHGFIREGKWVPA